MIHFVLNNHREMWFFFYNHALNKLFQWMKVQEKWILDSILLQHIKIKKKMFSKMVPLSCSFPSISLMCVWCVSPVQDWLDLKSDSGENLSMYHIVDYTACNNYHNCQSSVLERCNKQIRFDPSRFVWQCLTLYRRTVSGSTHNPQLITGG